MQIDFEIKNYRCFPDHDPLRFSIAEDWTAFIGVNNSGKSSILKFFFEFRDIFRRLSSITELVHDINQSHIHASLNGCNISDACNNTNTRNLTVNICLHDFPINEITISCDQELNKFTVTTLFGLDVLDKQLITGLRIVNELIQFNGISPIDPKPVLQALKRLSKTVYIGSFRNILNTGATTYFDISVGTQFVHVWETMYAGDNRKNRDHCQQVIESIEKLLDIQRLELRPMPGNNAIIVHIDGKSYQLSELGAGVAQLILVIATVAQSKPDYVLIDEPELGLHPSLQLSFLAELGRLAKCGLLFSTHSVGLARSCANRLYSINKIAQGQSRITYYERTPKLSELLGSLNYSSYHALGFDVLLLVEGVSEMKVFQQLLKKINLDHKIVLLPLGGSQLINGNRDLELGELKRITHNVYAIVDSEKASSSSPLPADRLAFQTSCDSLGIKCHILTFRATENYLHEYAIKKVVGSQFGKLEPFEKMEGVKNWGKDNNWKIVSEMSWQDFESTDVGSFLLTIKDSFGQ